MCFGVWLWFLFLCFIGFMLCVALVFLGVLLWLLYLGGWVFGAAIGWLCILLCLVILVYFAGGLMFGVVYCIWDVCAGLLGFRLFCCSSMFLFFEDICCVFGFCWNLVIWLFCILLNLCGFDVFYGVSGFWGQFVIFDFCYSVFCLYFDKVVCFVYACCADALDCLVICICGCFLCLVFDDFGCECKRFWGLFKFIILMYWCFSGCLILFCF